MKNSLSLINRILFDNVKNIITIKSKKKYVLFSVDDYGNVRLNSKESREQLNRIGCPVQNRFDAFDSLENKEDLEMLFGVLEKFKDSKGNSPMFTAYALPCNLNFEKILESNFTEYHYETLPKTFDKLTDFFPKSYSGAWNLWQEGIQKKLIEPEFHGREHLNISLFYKKLLNPSSKIKKILGTRSYASLNDSADGALRWNAAFSFDQLTDVNEFIPILDDGVHRFKEVFKRKPICFTPPGQEFPLELEKDLKRFGFHLIDKPFTSSRLLISGKRKREFNFSGSFDHSSKLYKVVRNVLFEPTNGNKDHVGNALRQIDMAFRWNNVANISSHRVNFSGNIDPRNRKKGLDSLEILISSIVSKWPDVEFISVRDFERIIKGNKL